MGMAVLDLQINYKREAQAGWMLEIHSCPIEIKAKAARFFGTTISCETGGGATTIELLVACLDAAVRKTVTLPEMAANKFNYLGEIKWRFLLPGTSDPRQ